MKTIRAGCAAVVGLRQSTQAKPSFILGLFRVLGHESHCMKNSPSKSDFNMAQLPLSLILCERQRRPAGLVQALLIYEHIDGLNTIGTGEMGQVNSAYQFLRN
ncbi:hypothetical protein P692DRAFT_20276032 [Suillus brevipes Sb2]|nr:hypothetical protein P692DRAFT_20276032 [Suillus brevipes Sb2]